MKTDDAKNEGAGWNLKIETNVKLFYNFRFFRHIMAKEKGTNPTPSKAIGIIDFKVFLEKNSETNLRQTNVTYLKCCKRLLVFIIIKGASAKDKALQCICYGLLRGN